MCGEPPGVAVTAACRRVRPAPRADAARAASGGPAHLLGLFPHPDYSGRYAAHDRVFGHVLRDHGVRADHRVVAHGHAAQDAGAVADPDVVAHAHVGLVDPLDADRAVDLNHPVVEVDQHHAVGDHALAPDRDMLVRGDRAL